MKKDSAQELDVSDADIYAVINQYILSIINDGVSYEEGFEIVYDSDTEAHTHVLISDGRTLKLALQKNGDFWNVVNHEMILEEY